MTLAFYPFAYAKAFCVEVHARLRVDEGGACNAALTLGQVDDRQRAPMISSAGEVASVVSERSVDPVRPGWSNRRWLRNS